MQKEELARLHQAVHAAEAEVHRPFEPGELSRPITFFTDHLDDGGWRLGWTLVAALRESHPGLFGRYSETGLHHAALEFLLAADDPPSIDQVGDALHAQAVDEGPWLVTTPLANVSLDRPWVALSSTAAIRRAEDAGGPGTEEWGEHEREDLMADAAVRRHLGDFLPAAHRFLRLNQDSQLHLDTGRAATILSVEDGTALVAIDSARAKAHYALATWSVLEPPRDWHLLPDLGVWSAQPVLHERARHKRLESGEVVAKQRRRGGDYRRWGPYELPGDDVLTAPFEAFACLDRRPAQALLSGTAAHYAAARASRSQLSERIRDARAAIECLCEPPTGGGSARVRWTRLAARFSVWDRLADARAYTPGAVAELQSRLVNARNIGTHGADAALIDLGWIGGDRTLRSSTAPATDLAVPALQRDLGPMLFAIGEALRGAWAEMRRAGFDDGAFEALFTTPTSR